VTQIVQEVAKRCKWAMNKEVVRSRRAQRGQQTKLDKRVALELKIQELYGDQLPKSAFRWSAEVKVLRPRPCSRTLCWTLLCFRRAKVNHHPAELRCIALQRDCALLHTEPPLKKQRLGTAASAAVDGMLVREPRQQPARAAATPVSSQEESGRAEEDNDSESELSASDGGMPVRHHFAVGHFCVLSSPDAVPPMPELQDLVSKMLSYMLH